MRLFIAVHFPPAVLADLNERVASLRPRLPSASWVKEGSQHVTLAFLGEQDEAKVVAFASPLEQQLREIGSFESRLHGCGFFPNPRRARVGWIGLEPEAPFVKMAAVVRETVTAHGIALDAAEFRPHLTLMRMRDAWPPASIELFSKSLRDYSSAPFSVSSVTLFASQLDPKGAIHTALRTFGLGNEK